MLSINTADMKQLSGSEKLSGLLRNVRLTQATFRSADRHPHQSLPGCGFTAGTLETPRIFSEWANESNMYATTTTTAFEKRTSGTSDFLLCRPALSSELTRLWVYREHFTNPKDIFRVVKRQ